MTKILTALAVALMLGAFAVMTQDKTAEAGGFTVSRAEKAGFTCFTPEPDGAIHCLKKDPFSVPQPPTVRVLIFDASNQHFLGTEILIRSDLYAGQPCPTDEVISLTFGFEACHHFDFSS